MGLLIAHFCSINQPAIVPKKQTEEGMVVNELYGYVCNPMAITDISSVSGIINRLIVMLT